MFQKIYRIKLPYRNTEEFFQNAHSEIFDFIRSSYCNLLKGDVYNWECDIFAEDVKGNRWQYTKHHSLYCGFSLNTTLNSEKEKELLRNDDFRHGYYSLKKDIIEEFKGIIDGVSMTNFDSFYVHLTNVKSKEILSTHIGQKFEIDKYVLLNENEIYEM